MSKPSEVVVKLEPALDDFIRAEAQRGSFASSSEYIHDLLQDHFEATRKRKLEALDAALDRGLADIEAGRYLPLDEAFAEVRRRLGITDRGQ